MVSYEVRLPYKSVNHLNEEIKTPFMYEGREFVDSSSKRLPCVVGSLDFGNNASTAIFNIKKLTGADFKLLRSSHLTPLVSVKMLSPMGMSLLQKMENPTVHYVYITAGHTCELHAAYIEDQK